MTSKTIRDAANRRHIILGSLKGQGVLLNRGDQKRVYIVSTPEDFREVMRVLRELFPDLNIPHSRPNYPGFYRATSDGRLHVGVRNPTRADPPEKRSSIDIHYRGKVLLKIKQPDGCQPKYRFIAGSATLALSPRSSSRTLRRRTHKRHHIR